MKFAFSNESRRKLEQHAQTLPPSTDRAMCYRLTQLKGDCIATAIANDHASVDGPLRAATLAVQAGVAREIPDKNPLYFGAFVFEDDSQIN